MRLTPLSMGLLADGVLSDKYDKAAGHNVR
jgi:hypothetical protein